MDLINQDMASIFSQSANQSTDTDKRFQVSSVLSFPPVSTLVIRNLLSTIKKLIRMLSNLGACMGVTQVHLIAQDTASIFSQYENQSTDSCLLYTSPSPRD